MLGIQRRQAPPSHSLPQEPAIAPRRASMQPARASVTALASAGVADEAELLRQLSTAATAPLQPLAKVRLGWHRC
jgi:hypothetical protein